MVAVPTVSVLCSNSVGVQIIAGDVTIGLADTTPDRPMLNATVRVAMLASCGDALVLTPVAIVTVHSECFDSDVPALEAVAFSVIIAPQVPACDCPPLPYVDPAALWNALPPPLE